MASVDGSIEPLEQSPQGCATAFLLSDFDINSGKLKRLHKKLLERIADILKSNSDHRARLVGRASRSGTDAVDMQVSKQRAEAVAKFLRGLGVGADQIQVEFIGKSAPFSKELEADEDRSVEVHMQIARVLTIVLENAHLVRPTSVLIAAIREPLDPLVKQAGRELQVIQQRILPRQGELTITFTAQQSNRLCGTRILGQDAGGIVFVGAHEAMRACGGVRGGPDSPDYNNQVDPLFDNGQPEFARFVANTAVHELGHMLGIPEHSLDRFNYMSNEDLPDDLRTGDNLRKFYSMRLHFDDNQKRRLVCAIQTGNFPAGAPSMSRVP
jgi:hypothetical protein